MHNGLTYKIGLHGKPFYRDSVTESWVLDLSISAEFVQGLIDLKAKIKTVPPMPDKTVGERALFLRNLMGVSQMVLAEKMGIATESVETLEADKYKKIQTRHRAAYRDLFGINPYWLSTGLIKGE